MHAACAITPDVTSQVCLINTEETGKVEFYASFINCIVTILSQRLVIQAHYNDTLPDLSKVLQKQSWQVLSQFDQFHYLFYVGSLYILFGEQIDKHIRKAILALKNII